MVTFSCPILIAVDYCRLEGVVLGMVKKTSVWGDGDHDHFEYLLLSSVYLCLAGGALICHCALTRLNKSRTFALYFLIMLLMISFVPQMSCFSPHAFLCAALLTLAVVGGIQHVLTLSCVELFPSYIRGTALGFVFAGGFLGALFGPYVDLLINAGTLKSVYGVFYVVCGTLAVLINRGVADTQHVKVVDSEVSYGMGEPEFSGKDGLEQMSADSFRLGS